MNPILNFLIESSICLILFYGFYELVQKKEGSFRYNRLYLIGTFLLSLVIPLIKIQLQDPIPVISAASFNNIIQLPELVIGSGGTTEAMAKSPFNWTVLLVGLYFFGMAIFLIRFFKGLYKIVGIIRKSERKQFLKLENATIIPTEGRLPSCSFFNYIFWDGTLKQDELKNSQIFMHELAHVKHKHSWDILLLEVSSIILWFNPVIHLFKMALKEVHEYIIDAEIANSTDRGQYIKVLANQSIKELDLIMIHPFNKSQIMKRINMLEKGFNKSNWLKISLIVPLIAAMAVVFSCQTDRFFDSNHLTELPEGWTLLKKGETNAVALEQIERLKIENPGVEFRLVKLESSTGFANGNKYWSLNNINYKGLEINNEKGIIIGTARAFPDGNSPYKDARNVHMVKPGEANQSEVFTVVEEQPVPEGGMMTFYQYVQKEIKYPEPAKTDTIQGKVYVQFVVDKDGSITDVQAVKGIGGGCDEEAVRVIANSQKWKPGKQKGQAVKVRMILPITFSLGLKNTDSAQLSQIGEITRPMPEGGMAAYGKYITDNLQYPEQAKRNNIQGKVYLEFMVNKDGTIYNITVARGISSDCDAEAVRIIANGPKWVPAKHNGKVVVSKTMLPISFALDSKRE